jgi:hypothetical protein
MPRNQRGDRANAASTRWSGNCSDGSMRNWGWLAVLGGCSLLACGGSARTTHDQGADTGDTAGGGAGGSAGADDIAGGAGAGDTAGGAGSVHLRPGSWEVSGDINALTTPALTCGRFDFTMTVNDRGTLTLGRNGEMHSAPVQILDGAYVARFVQLVGKSEGLPCAESPNVVDELRLEGVDLDGDAEADELEGTVSLSFDTETATGKAETTTLTSRLTGTPDRSRPTLIVPAAELNPLDFATILASEPLGPTAKLTLTGTNRVDLKRYERSDPPVPGALSSPRPRKTRSATELAPCARYAGYWSDCSTSAWTKPSGLRASE